MSSGIRVGKVVKNNNGTYYTILAVMGNRALLHGGFDFVVIDELDYFEESGSWGNGKYFPCFVEEDSYKMLTYALYYFRHRCYPPEDHPLYKDL